jgi:tRNA threonylcarbamoyladenosine biosynthesis protein TsaB
MEKDRSEIRTLSIECAVDRGSVAVLRGSSTLASTGEASQPSRAEEVLITVRSTLDEVALSLQEIDQIVVSTGPGSYSGIRIGLSTAMGLGKGLSRPVLGVSVLDALSEDSGGEGSVVTAVAVGKRHVAWCRYDTDDGAPKPVGEPVLVTDDEFLESLTDADQPFRIVWSDDLGSRLADRISDVRTANGPSVTIAELVGRYAVKYPDRTSMAPLYLRDQQFAKA